MDNKEKEEAEMEQWDDVKNKGLNPIIIIFIILIIIATGSFIYINKDKLSNNKPSQETQEKTKIQNNEDKKEQTEETKEQTEEKNNQDEEDRKKWIEKMQKGDLSSKCLNCKENTYYTFPETETNAEVEPHFILKNDNNKVLLTINWNSFCGWSKLKECPSGKKEYQITGFDKKVKSVLDGGFGQAIDGTVFFYLLEDGTIMYNPLFSSNPSEHPIIKTDEHYSEGTFEPNSLIAQTPKEALKDITALYQVSVTHHTEDGGWAGGAVTTIAMKADGTFYDLEKMLQ